MYMVCNLNCYLYAGTFNLIAGEEIGHTPHVHGDVEFRTRALLDSSSSDDDSNDTAKDLGNLRHREEVWGNVIVETISIIINL